MDTLTEGRINCITVHQLKQQLEKLKLESAGKKQVLTNRLISQLKSNTADEITDNDEEATDGDASDEDGGTSCVKTKKTKGRRDEERPLARSIKFMITDVARKFGVLHRRR